jgi:hypothetical protein
LQLIVVQVKPGQVHHAGRQGKIRELIAIQVECFEGRKLGQKGKLRSALF